MEQAFPLCFCILEAIKNWTVGRPGNEARIRAREPCYYHTHVLLLLGAQMVMTDVSDFKERATTLGRLGVSYGVGMVVGPVVGGFVTTSYSEQSAAAVAAMICLVAIVTVMVFVPRSTKNLSKATTEEASKDKTYGECLSWTRFSKCTMTILYLPLSLSPSFPLSFLSVSPPLPPPSLSTLPHLLGSGSVFNLQAILSLLAIPAVLYILVLKTVVGIPGGVFNAMFTVTNMERFELTPKTNGYLLGYMGVISMVSYLGVISMVSYLAFISEAPTCMSQLSVSLSHTHIHTQLVQAFGVGFFSKRFSDNTVLLASILTMTFSYLFLVCNCFLLFQVLGF